MPTHGTPGLQRILGELEELVGAEIEKEDNKDNEYGEFSAGSSDDEDEFKSFTEE